MTGPKRSSERKAFMVQVYCLCDRGLAFKDPAARASCHWLLAYQEWMEGAIAGVRFLFVLLSRRLSAKQAPNQNANS